MAAKKKAKASKVSSVKSESCACCGGNELERVESGLLLLIGLIWVLQVLNVFAFGGQYFQIIGSMLVLVIGATKFVALNTECKC